MDLIVVGHDPPSLDSGLKQGDAWNLIYYFGHHVEKIVPAIPELKGLTS